MMFQQVASMLWIFVKFFLTQKKVGAWCCDCFLTNALIAYFDETFRQRLYTITPWLILQVYFPPSWTDKQQRKLLEKPKRDAKAQNSEEGRSQDTEPRSRSSVFLWLNRVSGVPRSRCKKDQYKKSDGFGPYVHGYFEKLHAVVPKRSFPSAKRCKADFRSKSVKFNCCKIAN